MASRGSTTLATVRFALEDSFGVSEASPTWRYPHCTRLSITPDHQPIQPRHFTGDVFLRTPQPGVHTAPGTFDFNVGPENFSWFLAAIFNANLSSANPTTGVYQHTMKPGINVRTFEGQGYQTNGEWWAHGGYIRSATFGLDVNSFLTCSLDTAFQYAGALTDGQVPTNPSLSVLDNFSFIGGTMERDDGAVTDMDSFSLRIEKNFIEFPRFGLQYAGDVVPGKQEVTWEIGMSPATLVEMRRFLGDDTDTGQQNLSERFDNLKLEWTFQTAQYADDPAVVYPYQLKFTAYTSVYGTWNIDWGSDSELMRNRVPVLVRYNSGQTTDLEAYLVNTLSGAAMIA